MGAETVHPATRDAIANSFSDCIVGPTSIVLNFRIYLIPVTNYTASVCRILMRSWKISNTRDSASDDFCIVWIKDDDRVFLLGDRFLFVSVS
jgi:hypothetical protein